jgi:ribosome recycling factor
MTDTKPILRETEERMGHAVEALERDLRLVRTGRADIGLLDQVRVQYYGDKMPLHHLATLSTPDPRTIAITPWDKNITEDIARAIAAAELGLNPITEGNLIRVPIPPLSNERRQELAKAAGKRGEEAKVMVRNIRRDAVERIRALERDSELSEDESKRVQNEIQRLTERYTEKSDTLVEAKKKDLTTL